jgi:hypothetical protein
MVESLNGNGVRVRKSALEDEFRRHSQNLRWQILAHDRGVLLAAALSCVPIFPAAAFGLALGLFNRSLLRRGRLEASEAVVVRRFLVVAAINTVIGAALLALAAHFVRHAVPGVEHWLHHATSFPATHRVNNAEQL